MSSMGGLSESDLRHFYNNRYHGDYMEGFEGAERLRSRCLQEVISRLDIMPRTVLDAGCGRGRYAEIITRVYPECTISGCDISSVAIEHCRLKYPKGDFRVSSARRIPFPDSEFDLVISVEVMEHVQDVDVYVCEVSRVLRQGGLFVFTTPCANPLSYEWFLVMSRRSGRTLTPDGYQRWYYEDSGHLRRLKSKEAETILLRNGLVRKRFYFRTHLFGALNWMYADIFRRPGRRYRGLRKRLRFVATLLDQLAMFEWMIMKRIPIGASMIGVFCKR